MNKRTPPTTAAKTPPVMPFCWSLMSPILLTRSPQSPTGTDVSKTPMK